MLCSLTMTLFENMARNKNFILTFNLYEKWHETAFTASLISASCAKNFDDRNSLALCLFTESAGTDRQVVDFGNDLFTSSKYDFEAAEVTAFVKKKKLDH